MNHVKRGFRDCFDNNGLRLNDGLDSITKIPSSYEAKDEHSKQKIE